MNRCRYIWPRPLPNAFSDPVSSRHIQRIHIKGFFFSRRPHLLLGLKALVCQNDLTILFVATTCYVFNTGVTQGEISAVDVKSLEKCTGQFNGHCFTEGGASCFSLQWCQLGTKGYTAIIQGGGMLSILLFSANLCGNRHSLAVSGVVFIEAMV